MLGTKVLLNPLNALFAKVHHPPPLDKRESKRLLKALTASFRKNLDQEHGYWLEDASSSKSLSAFSSAASVPSSTPTAASITNTAAAAATAAAEDSHRRPTDRHVRAILSNPLFSYDPSKVTTTQPAERDPMDVFDQAVAKGLMSPERAAGVLIAKRQAIAQSASISVNESIAASGTAVRVLQWLRSSGLERDLTFLKCQSLVSHLIPFMVEEGLEEVAWMWLDRWMRGEGRVLTPRRSVMHASYLLEALVRVKVSPTNPLNNGYAAMIRAGDMFRTNQDFAATAIRPWSCLSRWSTIWAWQRSQPSEALFDSFAAMSDPLQKQAASVGIDRAYLDVHHPTHPDATLAVRYLKSPMIDRLAQWMIQRHDSTAEEAPSRATVAGSSTPMKMVETLILMGSDAAQLLTRAGREAEAEWVRNLMFTKFGDFIRREMKGENARPDLRLFQHASWTT